jgi:hypothetical protein
MFYLIILIFLILVFILSRKSIPEKFDNVLSNITLEGCASACTNIYGCKTVYYNNFNNTCFLERDNKEKDRMYNKYNNNNYYKCEKLVPLNPKKTLNFKTLGENMIYNCGYEADLKQQFMIANNNKYEIQENMCPNYQAMTYQIKHIDWNDRINVKNLDIENLELLPKKVINYTKIEKNNLDAKYLFDYKCVKNISDNTCKELCSERPNCSGYKYYNNTCCPIEYVSKFTEDDNINYIYNQKV